MLNGRPLNGMNMCLGRVHAASHKMCPDFKNLMQESSNCLVIASDPRICPNKIDSLKSKPSKR